jgi:antibiotic biosynthesis monooxygenase (ABM) superfamily enzyme
MAQRVESQEAPKLHGQGEPPPAAAPPRYKLALLTWAGAYAVITLILAVLGPAMAPWPLPLRTLLLSVLMVVAMTWLVIPSLTRLFQGWLTPVPLRSVRPAPRDRQYASRHAISAL